MFDIPGPRLFALPPGADFPRLLVEGILSRMQEKPPEAMAEVTVFLNTTRMRRRVQSLLTAQGARFLPRLRLVTDLGTEVPFADLPAAVTPLRRRLELSVLIDRLLVADPGLAPRSALFDLADSLADLMDEMQGEGVAPETIAALDVSGHSAHWARTKAFLGIVSAYFDGSEIPDPAARQRLVIDRLLASWESNLPQGPMIVAGSTGSRGATMRLMRAVARLPQGAILLPGFDFELPDVVWAAMADPMTSEDHPQYRFRRLLEILDLPTRAIQPWTSVAPPSPARNRLVSLALRPAPVTDQWRVEGQHLPDLIDAVRDVTLIEAQSPREEALAIATALREAVETDVTAALITPDRDLARRVTAALDRWGIRPDDSAGLPIAQSAPGRFLRQVAGLAGRKITADMLLALLKNPIAFSGGDRGPHLRLVRELELHIRRHGPAFPNGSALADWALKQRDTAAVPWAGAVAAALDGVENVSVLALSDHLAAHLARTEAFARGTGGNGSGTLWAEEEGAATLKAMTELAQDASAGGALSAQDYLSLFTTILQRGEVRRAVTGHPQVMIWGTLEARVQGVDLVILGGMTEGSWPAAPTPDPWLNRAMRKTAGLLLPERKIGLSAHDFQQAIAAPRVILTYALRSAEAETVPSRWLNRLMNLMSGLPERSGAAALAEMKARGARYLDWAAALDRPARPEPSAPRPAPRPPVSQRPKELSLTRIERLIRDPYAIYARYVLNLQPLQPLRAEAGARLRGEVVHAILERFVKARPEGETPEVARARLLSVAGKVLVEDVPWPAARLFWQVRMEKAATDFLASEAASGGRTLQVETKGRLTLHPLDFTLSGTPDRIDELPDGRLHLIDYKTGTPPTKPQQAGFAKQLLLAAVMAERGGFYSLGPREVARISYIGIKAGAPTEATDVTPEDLEQVWVRTLHLIGRYLVREQGYTSRRAMFETRSEGDYDHLARFGEWDGSTKPTPVDVGPGEDA